MMHGPLNPIVKHRVMSWIGSKINDELARRMYGELYESLRQHVYAAENILSRLWLNADDSGKLLPVESQDPELRSANNSLENELHRTVFHTTREWSSALSGL